MNGFMDGGIEKHGDKDGRIVGGRRGGLDGRNITMEYGGEDGMWREKKGKRDMGNRFME